MHQSWFFSNRKTFFSKDCFFFLIFYYLVLGYSLRVFTYCDGINFRERNILMKKIAMLAVITVIMATSSVAKAGAGDTILLYIPNRIVDMMDMFSLTLGFGPAIGIQGQITKSCSLGGEIGFTAQMIKGINRQYGFALDSGWDFGFLMIAAEQRERQDAMGSVKNYFYNAKGVPSPEKIPYDFHKGTQDFWAIGGKIAALIEVKAEFNPIEIADFVLGWLFIDIKGDDFTADSLDM